MNPKTGAAPGIELDRSDTHDGLAGGTDPTISYRALAQALLAAADIQLAATRASTTSAPPDPKQHKVLDK